MKNISDYNDYLFKFVYKSRKDDDALKEREILAKKILKENSWEEIFETWNNYLRNDCKTPMEIINYLLRLYCYAGDYFRIPPTHDPYDFMGYLLAKVDLDKYWDEGEVIMDTFAIKILNIDLMEDPYYQFWEDPKVIEAAKKYQQN